MEGDKRQGWIPERIFFSHATADKEITSKVKEAIKKLPGEYEIFISEHQTSGTPLFTNLKEEMLRCNGIIVAWTPACNQKKTSQIISFEVGMAYSLGMPIFLLKFDNVKMPWFFEHVTKYYDVESSNTNQLADQLGKLIDLSLFFHPIDIVFKKEAHPSKPIEYSKNMMIVQDDGSLIIPSGFEGILHYWVENRRKKPEKDVDVTIIFPSNYILDFDAGTLEPKPNEVHKTHHYHSFRPSSSKIKLKWDSLPLENIYFEVRVKNTPVSHTEDYVVIRCSSESLITTRTKIIPLLQT